MSHNTFGHLFRVTTWGESHGPAIGCVVDGCPPGIPLTADEVQLDLDRRRLYLEEAERVLLADHAVIPLYFYVSKHLVKPEVEGWQDNILNYHYSQHLSFGAAERDGRP